MVRKGVSVMKCLKCGKHMGVTNTYSGDQILPKLKFISNPVAKVTPPEQMVVRLRKCTHCEYYYYTIEILDESPRVSLAMRETMKRKFSE